MRIQVLTQHFAPEVTASRVRLEAFAAGLAERGHDVDVVCAVPNHPAGVVPAEYRGKAFVDRRSDGYRVRHVWVRASPSKTPAARILLYASYAASATVAGSVLRRPDVVFASSPPLPVGAAAALVAARHRAPWVLDVRDLWPEAAVILGVIPDGRLARATAVLERRLYRAADAIVTVTQPFRDHIVASADAAEKVSVIMNGTTRTWLDAGDRPPERAALGLPEDSFLWAYAGNLGIAQGLEAAVDAAALLDEHHHLLLLGDGPRRAALEERARVVAPDRITFHGLVQPEVAARYLRAADALLVPLDAKPELRKFVPSKLFDCCAVGRPVIVAAAGEADRLITEAKAGIAVPPGDPAALAATVGRLEADPALRERLATAGREFALGNLRERQVLRLEQIFHEVTSTPRYAAARDRK